MIVGKVAQAARVGKGGRPLPIHLPYCSPITLQPTVLLTPTQKLSNLKFGPQPKSLSGPFRWLRKCPWLSVFENSINASGKRGHRRMQISSESCDHTRVLMLQTRSDHSSSGKSDDT